MAEKLIPIKHHLASGCCMWSGIEDLYAMRTGQEVPEGFLLGLSSFGETVFLKMNKKERPYMFSANDARPKTAYENIKEQLGLSYKIVGGRTLAFAKKTVKEEIDHGNPVILGPLDMYYLPYLKMYQKEHVPIHFIMMAGYDEEANCVLIYDCDREELIRLSMSDLEQAWSIKKNGVGDKNGFIRFTLKDHLPDKYELAASCLKAKAERQLRDKPYLLGVSAYEKIAKELPKWRKKFSEEEYKRALISITEFMGRVPKIPNRILGVNDEDVPYQANYDRLSSMLDQLGQEYEKVEWQKAARLLKQCGGNIEKIVNGIVRYCCDGEDELDSLPKLFLENAALSREAYQIIRL